MVEEGSISLRPWGFTLCHSFIINLPHLGFGELGTPPLTGTLFCCSLLQFANMECPSLTAGIKEKGGRWRLYNISCCKTAAIHERKRIRFFF